MSPIIWNTSSVLRKNSQRSGSNRRSDHFIDDSTLYAIPSKFACHRKPDGTGADHKNIYKHKSFLTRNELVDS